MKRLKLCLPLCALALLACFLVGADREKPAGKHDLIRGTVQEVEGNQITVRDTAGKDWKLEVDDRSSLRLDGKDARPADFRKGTRVRVRYESKDGRNHVVLLRTPLAAKVLAEEGKDFLRNLKSYSYDKRDEYERKLSAALADLDERIEDLQDQAARSTPEVRRKVEADIKDLQTKRDALRDKLASLKRVKADTWEDVKSDLDRALSDLQRGLDRARERLR